MEEIRKSSIVRDLIIKIFLILLFVFLITILFPMPNLTAFYDSVLLKIIKNYVTKYRGKTIEEIKNDNQLWTINNKISAIYADKSIQQDYKDICVKISVDLTMLNDFGHSAGIYMTPLIDVEINDLYKIYKDINKDDSIYAPIVALA